MNKTLIDQYLGSSKQQHELVIALCGGAGVCFDVMHSKLVAKFLEHGFEVIPIHVFDECIEPASKHLNISSEFAPTSLRFKMDLGNQVVKHFNSADYIGALIVEAIHRKRQQSKKNQRVFIINSIKREAELSLLQSIYGEHMLMLSIFSSHEDRLKRLQTKCKNESEAKACIDKDEADTDESLKKFNFGQQVQKLFPKAHYFINESETGKQINRFIDILFDAPYESPNDMEYGMFLARAVAMRSLDVSRQVGAVFVDANHNVLSIGKNHIPHGTQPDHIKGCEFNNTKIEKIKDEIESNAIDRDIKKFCRDILEPLDKITAYYRTVHAEMSAICDAVRRGISLQNSLLYVTTYPCHDCMKHLIDIGIEQVVYIDPYPKSEAEEMFPNSVCNIAKSQKDVKRIECIPFSGVAPSHYLEFFRRDRDDRRDENDDVRQAEYRSEVPRLITSDTDNGYINIEESFVSWFKAMPNLK